VTIHGLPEIKANRARQLIILERQSSGGFLVKPFWLLIPPNYFNDHCEATTTGCSVDGCESTDRPFKMVAVHMSGERFDRVLIFCHRHAEPDDEMLEYVMDQIDFGDDREPAEVE
jgi:hypothetical protein